MRFGFVIYPGFTALDAVGPYEILSRLGGEVRWVSFGEGPVATDSGASLLADTSFEDCPDLDVLLVPGGPGQEDFMSDERMLSFLRRQADSADWVTSVCTGGLLLGAAGLLEGRRATTHWLAIERLADFGATPVSERFVEDGNVITAAGVSAGIDMALVLAERLRGRDAAEMIQLFIEYDPQPPFQAGSPKTARTELVESARALSRHPGLLGSASP